MKKTGIFILAAIMVFAFSFEGVGQAFAAQAQKSAGQDIRSLKELKEPEGEYMANAALVMFKVTKNKVTKSQTRKTLSTGKNSVSDISVKNLWTFSPEPELVSDSSGKRKLVRKDGRGREYIRVALVKSQTMSTKELVKKFSSRKDVKYAQPNYRVKAQSVSDDEYSDYQWSMQGSESKPSTTAPNIWNQWKKQTGSEDIVAVVDTGVDYTHPDLKDRMWENDHYPSLKGECGYDFINGDDDPMDDNDHGTHCAGIIGATGDNGIGISGVNKKIRIMALKTLNDEGSAFLSHEIAAYNYIDTALDLGEPVKAINNSWGGGDENYIFGELIDIVGEKGAVTVVAAGNKGTDCDEEQEYPASIDSPYMISVAATREDGKKAGYSNYGKRTVDTAAPGSDILSTVAHGCYNPTIYGSRQNKYSAEFNDYESAGGWSDVNALKNNFFLNGSKMIPGTGKASEINIKSSNEGFNTKGNGDAGKSVCIEADEIGAGGLVCMSIPYEITQDTKEAPFFSTMYRTAGTPGGIFGIIETQRGDDMSLGNLGNIPLEYGAYIMDDELDAWGHASVQTLDKDELHDLKKEAAELAAQGGSISDSENPLKRKIILLIYSESGGSANLCLDDIGLSIENYGDADIFGKYNFMSGTSMAAPYVSGAVALKAAEMESAQTEGADSETLINEVVSMTRSDEKIHVIQKGVLDFTKRPSQLPPRAGRILVDQSSNTLKISGSGLGAEGTKVEIGDDEENLEVAEITSASDRALTVKNRNWINNIKTVKVTGTDGKESFRRDVYLVNGKKTIGKKQSAGNVPSGQMTTDGKKIYWTDNEYDSISVMDPKAKGNDEEEEFFAVVDPKKIFKIKEKKNAEYDMIFTSAPVYANGSIYTTVEYGMSDTSEEPVVEEGDEFQITFFDEDSGETTIYSGQSRLICTKSGKKGGNTVVNLGKLPAALEKTADYTMTAYNGKIFFIGGYSYDKDSKGLTDKVWVYDPKTKKWSAGSALPEKRAGGKAIQSGSKLIYTMGYSEASGDKDIYDQQYPVNLIFDGRKWKKSSVAEEKSIEPLVIDRTIRRGGKEYLRSACDIGLIKGGVMFTGVPAADYGDIFTYRTSKDRFADTGYNFIRDINEEEIRGIVVGSTMYGFKEADFENEEDGAVYTLPVKSGLVKVKASASKNGTIKGAGGYMPGNTASIKVKAKKNYRIKSLKLDGKKISVKKNQSSRRLTLKNLVKDRKVSATFEKYKFKVKIVKKGKGKITGGKIYLKGKSPKIKISAKKGWYIKSVKCDGKKIKVGKKAKKKTFTIKKIKKDVKVKVVFKKQ